MTQKRTSIIPFEIDNNIQAKLKFNDESFMQEELRRENTEISPYIYEQSCVPRCYVQCLQCCGKQMIWMRLLFPCLCACVDSPFYKQSNARFGIVENFGRYKKTLEPGLSFINPFTERVVSISRQTQITECIQPIFTKDNIFCTISSVIYFRVVDPKAMLYKLGQKELIPAVQEMAISAVRTVCSQSLFQDLVEKRNKFSRQLLTFMNSQLFIWGILVENIFIKDILLDSELDSAMSLVTRTKRKAEATILGAKALVETAKFYKQASQALDTKAAQQIRYLSTLSEISQVDNLKILMVHMDKK